MSADDDKLKDGVLKLLGSPALKRINFVAADIRIGPAAYGKLIPLIRSGVIKVKVDPSLTQASGTYQADNSDDEANTLKVKSLPMHKPVVVHELTHAAIDSMDLLVLPGRKFSARGLHRTEDEGIAYIAQCVYDRVTHQPITHANISRKPRLLRIAHVADAIAGNVVASGVSVYHVTPDEIRAMRNAVGQHPGYHKHREEPSPSDGIPHSHRARSCLELDSL